MGRAGGAARVARRRTTVPRGACALVVLSFLGAGRHTAAGDPDAVADEAAPRGAAHLRRVESLGEARALDELQRADEDPWIVAEELLLLGRPDAAKAVARSGLTEDENALAAYVERSPRPAPALAAGLRDAARLLAAGRPREAADRLEPGASPAVTVTEARALELRASALDALGRNAEAEDARSRLAGQAFALGWQRGELGARLALLDRVPASDRAARRRLLRRLLELDRDARDPLGSAGWCAKLGALETSENPRSARRWLLEGEGMLAALAKGEGLPTAAREDRARILTSLALVQRDLGETASALSTASRAYEISKALAPRLRAEAALALSWIHLAFGRLEDAEDRVGEAASLLRGLDPLAEARALGDLAWVRMRRGDVEGARASYAQVRASPAIDADPRARFVVRLHQAAVAIEAPEKTHTVEDLQRAVAELAAVVDDARGGAAPDVRAEIEANADALTGRALNLLGRPKAAVAPLEQAIEGSYARDLPGFRRFVAGELAHALRAGGSPKPALDVASDGLQSLEREVPTLPSSLALDSLAQSSASRLIEEAVAGALEVGQAPGLRAMLERTRGMVFVAETRRRRAAGARGAVPAASGEIVALADDASRAAASLASARAEGVRSRIAEARGELWRRRSLLRNAVERESLEESAGAPSPSPVADSSAESPLASDEALLYYVATDARCVVLVAVGERLQVVDLEGGRAAIEEEIAATRRVLIAGASGDAVDVLARLAKRLVSERLRAALATPDRPPVAHLYVSTAGPFSGLPWPALVDLSFRSAGTPPAAVPTVSLVASAGVLRELVDWTRPAGTGRILALGNPDLAGAGAGVATRAALFAEELEDLPGAAEEARAITDPARGDVLLLGAAAEESALRRRLFEGARPFDVLHLACHGRLYASQPSLSALALRPSPTDDGLLTVEEVSAWRFPLGPHLVVLSACRSGVGVPVSGDGEEGLVRAFLLAGARQVVAGLWAVPDGTTRDLMVAFHRIRRAEGLPPCECLRRAEAEVLRAGSADPRAWAGWCVWGPRR